MPKAHRIGDQRMCGATTISTGQNTNVFINGQLAAVEGDLNDHNNLGALISSGPGTIKINNKKAIATLIDNSNPDQIGLITHVTGLPTPATGSTNTNMYGGEGSFGGGLGSFGVSGLPNVGELLSFAGNIVGKVYRNADQGSNSGLLVMNETNANTQPYIGSTVTGVSSGRTFTFSSFYNS